jgi:glycosyltransferase involved in cell wall biosynthesis
MSPSVPAVPADALVACFRLVIVIPAYNAAATIGDTLRSLADLHQLDDYVDHVLLCDDASTDDTVSRAFAIWSGTVPLRVRQNDTNRGERATVNAAFAALSSAYSWIAVIHADDVARRDWLRQLVELAIGYPGASTICSSWRTFNENGIIDVGDERPDSHAERISGSAESVSVTIQKGCWWHFSGCLMNMAEFVRIGPFDENMPQLGDLDWLVRALASGGDVIYVPRALIDYRQHPFTVSSRSFARFVDVAETGILMNRWQGLAPKRVLGEHRRQVLFRGLRRCVRMLLIGRIADARIGVERLLQLVRA